MKLKPLSPREMQVAELVADDLSDKEIAMILRLKVRTVHEYLDRIGRKLGAARWARRRIIRVWIARQRAA